MTQNTVKIISFFFIISLGIIFNSAFSESPMVPEKNRIKKDHAPTPFSASEIYKACPSGRTTKYLIEIPDKESMYNISKFIDVGSVVSLQI